MTITQMVQNQQRQRIGELAQKQQGKAHINPYGTPGMSLNDAGDYRKTVPVDEGVVQQIKQVDFDPVHQSAETGQPAEKIHGSVIPHFDTVSISAEGAAQTLKLTRLTYTEGVDTLSLDATGESVEKKEWLKGDPNGDGSSVVLDITDYAALEASQRRNETYSQLMKSWNSLMNQLKQESESGSYDYFKTIRLFRSRSAEWEKSLEQTDPAAYQVWLDKFKNVVQSQNES